MTASQALRCASVMLPHIRPARWKAPLGRFDQRRFCAVLLHSNWTAVFWSLLSVPRNAVASAAMFAVAVPVAVADADGTVDALADVAAVAAAVVLLVVAVPTAGVPVDLSSPSAEHPTSATTATPESICRTRRRCQIPDISPVKTESPRADCWLISFLRRRSFIALMVSTRRGDHVHRADDLCRTPQGVR